MDFQKDYELAQLLCSRGQEDQISNLVDPKNLSQIMNLLNIEIVEPSSVSKNNSDEELPIISVEDAPHWPRYFEYLRTKKKPWNNNSLKSLDGATQKILEKLPRVTRDSFDSNGLVVGHVQAGKTANYTGLIAKAADQGYNLFIVFTGTTNSLREQTQGRLEKELFGNDNPESVSKPTLDNRWQSFTTNEEDGDFKFNLDSSFLIGNRPRIIIAKKFHTVLDNIVDFLKTTETEILDTKKLLLIDDEADYASINTLSDDENGQEEISEETKNATKTNESLRRIRNYFRCNAYVGYTATPFANVLIDPHYIDDELGKTLYPRDFIVSLQQPEEYFGTKEFFPELNDSNGEADKLCIVPDGEAEVMREGGNSNPENYGLPDSFLRAFTDFILTGAIKTLRLNDPNNKYEDKHHTMLVQTHHEIVIHEDTARRLTAVWDSWRNDLIVNSKKSWLVNIFKNRWENEFPASSEKWEDICDLICAPSWIRKIEILTVNRNSPTKLDYSGEPKIVVAIGGFSLGRGLTLEGLTISFFARTTKAYDTLLQMGRWFGFRKGYEDLIRVHLTSERYSCFRHLAIVEKEIRFDIARYDKRGCTPMDLAVRIQEHHTMKITSSMKMQSVRKTQKGWSASTVQTSNFDFSKTANLNHNLTHTDIFLKELGDDFIKKRVNYVWENINFRKITSFLSKFKFGKNATNFDVKEINEYIERGPKKEIPEMSKWSVALIGKNKGSFLDFGPGSIVPVERSRFLGTDDIGALVDSSHWILDLPGNFQDYTNKNRNYDKAKMLEVRSGANARGLLLVYIIDKESNHKDSKVRGNIFQEDEVATYLVGLALAFPDSPTEIAGKTYVSNSGVTTYD